MTVNIMHTNMLANVNDKYDKSSGSFVYDMTKPAAIELDLAYKEIGKLKSYISLDEATGEALTELTYQNGTFRRDGETDDQLRERHRQRIITPAQDGNKAQYIEWAEEFEGIGAVKVFPLWNGGNTVKVAITNRLYQIAEPSLINAFQTFLDPGSEGLGNGVAPIGAKVTVSGGVSKDINISGNVILAEGFTEPTGVAESISEYFKSIVYSKNSVSYMRLAVAILDTPSVVDLNNFTLNGGMADVSLIGEEIPILNSVNLTVVSS